MNKKTKTDKIIIDCIADLHGYKPKLPGGDLLILAGDYTASDKLAQWNEFWNWLKEQPYDKKILIAGNHDNMFKEKPLRSGIHEYFWQELFEFLDVDMKFEYLCDSGTEYKGLKIWGTPWTPWFSNLNTQCMAFCANEIYMDDKFKLIPNDLDILVTHGPMRHVLDTNAKGFACGSSSLRDNIERAQPRFHIFGHIHEQGGNQIMYNNPKGKNTWCVNCSYVNEFYVPNLNYVRIEV
jgi:predicted phosphohydrolase